MISFVTAVKLMKGYEDFCHRLKVYIECVAEGCGGANLDYEIIVVEDRCHRNVAYIADSFTEPWLTARNARFIHYKVAYANPFGFNLIEAFAKNVGINSARFPFVCVTNCDLVFNKAFFEALHGLKPRTLYRFLQYELQQPTEWAWEKITLDDSSCLNPSLADPHRWTVNVIAYKSGDIMLLDAATWADIKGFPENDVWYHSDLVVCQVLSNNNIPLVVSNTAKVYTFTQSRPALKDTKYFGDVAARYLKKHTCNE